MANKSVKKVLSPKQAAVKLNSVVKGIDNTSARIQKLQGEQQESLNSLTQLVGIVNSPAKPAKAKAKPAKAKPAKAKPGKAKAKPAKAKAKPAKAKAKPAKAKAKPAKAKAKPAKAKATANGAKPPLKPEMVKVLKTKKKIGRADLYAAVSKTGHSYSRQSLYNALKDKKTFKVNKEGLVELIAQKGATPTGSTKSGEVKPKTRADRQNEEAADRFITSVGKTSEIATVL